MATKIRLQRRGRKDYPFYQIIIADSRAPRDGKFIEKVGSYNPNTNPATITLNFERALHWLQTGAQPSDTVRSILSDEGVLLMKHLLGGVKKGAFTDADAETKFQAWKSGKDKAVQSVASTHADKVAADAKARLDAEKAKNNARSEAIAQKKAEENAAKAEAAAPVAEVAEPEVEATTENNAE